MAAPAMVLRPDWPEALSAAIDSALHRPFEWGRHDCGHFAAGCVAAMTGVHPLRAAGLGWHTEAQAQAACAAVGGLGLLARRVLGRPRRTVGGAAPRGAVVLGRSGGRTVLGVSLGPHWVAPGAAGLVAMSPAQAPLHWWWG